MTPQELYTIHNGMMAIAHENLVKAGMKEAAMKLQELAQDETGAIILHNLIQTVLEVMELDQTTEP